MCKWLRASGEGEASTWFYDFCVADGKGLRLAADIFTGMIPYNQGLESKWRWERNAAAGMKNLYPIILQSHANPG